MTTNDDMERGLALTKVSSVRIVDILIAIDVVRTTLTDGRGSRAYVAKSRDISRSIVTEALGRAETFLGCKLFAADDPLALTAHGRALAKEGAAFVSTLEAFRALVGKYPKEAPVK